MIKDMWFKFKWWVRWIMGGTDISPAQMDRLINQIVDVEMNKKANKKK